MKHIAKNNYNREVTLLDEKTVRITERYDRPRYRGYALGNCQFECEQVVNDIKEDCQIWVKPTGDFSSLITFNIDSDRLTGKTLAEDLEIYQKLLDEEFGKDKYEAFVLGAYIHSGTSFSINKCGNRVCRFDSSQLGFIGLPKNEADAQYPGNLASNAEKIAESLTAAWNGEFVEYGVIDELSSDTIEYLVTADYDEAREFGQKMLEKYEIDFDEIEVQY